MELFVSYVIMILESFIYYRFTNLNMDIKYKHKIRVFVFAIILFTLLSRKAVYNMNLSFWNSAMDILLYAVCFGIPFFFYNASVMKKILIPAVFILIISIYEILTIKLTSILIQKPAEELRESNSIVFYVISILLPVVLLLLINLIYKKKEVDLTFTWDSRIEMYIILIANVIFIVFTAQLWKFSVDKKISIELVLSTMMFIIVINSVMTIILIYRSYRRAEKQMEDNLKMQQIEMENRLNKDMTEVIESLRGLRHDMNTHMGVLKGLVDFGQYDELKEYLDIIYMDVKLSNIYLVIPHPALSILINSKIAKANDLKIEFEPIVSVKTIHLEDNDICALIGNLLENAIEACEKVTDNRYISFSIRESNDFCFIHCENTYEVKPICKGGTFVTSKGETGWHGIGIKNIRSIVNKYSGKIDIDVGELFVVDISLPWLEIPPVKISSILSHS